MLNKKDPMLDAVRVVMVESDATRMAIEAANKHFGVTSRKALPHELHEAYDKMVREETLEEKNVLRAMGAGLKAAGHSFVQDMKYAAPIGVVTGLSTAAMTAQGMVPPEVGYTAAAASTLSGPAIATVGAVKAGIEAYRDKKSDLDYEDEQAKERLKAHKQRIKDEAAMAKDGNKSRTLGVKRARSVKESLKEVTKQLSEADKKFNPKPNFRGKAASTVFGGGTKLDPNNIAFAHSDLEYYKTPEGEVYAKATYRNAKKPLSGDEDDGVGRLRTRFYRIGRGGKSATVYKRNTKVEESVFDEIRNNILNEMASIDDEEKLMAYIDNLSEEQMDILGLAEESDKDKKKIDDGESGEGLVKMPPVPKPKVSVQDRQAGAQGAVGSPQVSARPATNITGSRQANATKPTRK